MRKLYVTKKNQTKMKTNKSAPGHELHKLLKSGTKKIE